MERDRKEKEKEELNRILKTFLKTVTVRIKETALNFHLDVYIQDLENIYRSLYCEPLIQ